MNRKDRLYCRRCWQTFDRRYRHDAGSYYNGERLNGNCPGDIHPIPRQRPQERLSAPQLPQLDFSVGEPILFPAVVGDN